MTITPAGVILSSEEEGNLIRQYRFLGKCPMEWLGYIREALDSHPARIIEPGDRAHAAVAMILEEQPDGPSVLFIERSANENDHWSGQICFPGGRTERRDASPRHTAERETREARRMSRSSAGKPAWMRNWPVVIVAQKCPSTRAASC